MENSPLNISQSNTNLQQTISSNQGAEHQTEKNVVKAKNNALANTGSPDETEKNLKNRKTTVRAGKVKGILFPTEVRLALFIKDIKNPHESWKVENDLSYEGPYEESLKGENDIKSWEGVYSEEGKVVKIDWSDMSLEGELNWNYLPDTLQELNLSCNSLSGSLDLSSLPQSMKEFLIYGNLFSGSLDLSSLPQSMKEFVIYGNQFSGEVDLTSLPESMEYLDISNNQFSGKVDLTSLPKSMDRMERLDISFNKFSVELDLKKRLPPDLHLVELYFNQS